MLSTFRGELLHGLVPTTRNDGNSSGSALVDSGNARQEIWNEPVRVGLVVDGLEPRIVEVGSESLEGVSKDVELVVRRGGSDDVGTGEDGQLSTEAADASSSLHDDGFAGKEPVNTFGPEKGVPGRQSSAGKRCSLLEGEVVRDPDESGVRED
jgi:hypothetical protein